MLDALRDARKLAGRLRASARCASSRRSAAGGLRSLPADPDKLPLLRCEGHLPHRSGRRRDRRWRAHELTPFTPAQLAPIDVARRDDDACIVAGPGSGKTTVLVEYFRRLVDAGVDPLRILAITFTEKAAGNMRKKLAQAFQEQPETRAKLERAWVSTVHGFCARLLRENAVFAGIDPEFARAR